MDPLRCAPASHVLTEQMNRATGSSQLARNKIKIGGLACSVGPDDRGDGARMKFAAHRIDRDVTAEAYSKAIGKKCRAGQESPCDRRLLYIRSRNVSTARPAILNLDDLITFRSFAGRRKKDIERGYSANSSFGFIGGSKPPVNARYHLRQVPTVTVICSGLISSTISGTAHSSEGSFFKRT